jgi:hypothetical protein
MPLTVLMNVTLKATLKAYVSFCYRNYIKSSMYFQDIEMIVEKFTLCILC